MKDRGARTVVRTDTGKPSDIDMFFIEKQGKAMLETSNFWNIDSKFLIISTNYNVLFRVS